MRYSILTFGCRVNQADSLRFEEELCASGGRPAPSDQADLVIVNTCSVTATADQDARQIIRRVARNNPAARIVVTGCYATRKPDDTASLPGVIRLVPNAAKETLVSGLASDPGFTTVERFGDGGGPCGAAIEPGVAGRTAFTLSVQTGCNQQCAYCIVPTTRGRSRSRPVTAIIRDVERLAAAGFKEVTLAGVHLGSYGRDLVPAVTLTHLLCHLADVPADVHYRISSLEPMDCPRELVDLLVSTGRYAPHLHLPLQHASDRMLRAMSRPYTLSQYRSLVDDVRTRLPHATIGTDVIVGFPGESSQDFDVLEGYLARSPLTHIHLFPYSDRPGTRASRMPGRIPGGAVRERGRRIRAIASTLTQRFRRRQVGTIRPGLTLDDGTLVVTDNYLKVRIAPGLQRNQRVKVLLESTTDPMDGTVQYQ